MRDEDGWNKKHSRTARQYEDPHEIHGHKLEMSCRCDCLFFLYYFQCHKGRCEVVRNGLNLGFSFANEYDK